jgi:hypothetical protein
MKQTFIEKKFAPLALRMIELSNQILEEYEAMGFTLTLRQLYYQFISRNLFPPERTWRWTGSKWIRDPNGTPNADPNYKWLGGILTDGRIAGLVDWDRLEDRNRTTVTVNHWSSPGSIVRAAADQYRIDKWERQDVHIEVMVEKDALSGILDPVCRELDIGLTANKGYSSSSAMYEIGQRLQGKHDGDGKEVCLIYLGDHDPSGIDMTRDVDDRLSLYSELGEGQIEVVRLALNYDQVQLWQPPENPAKMTDARAKDYVKKFGMSSWELDAVNPADLAAIIRREVEARRDDDLWAEAVAEEEEQRAALLKFADGYGKK